MLQDIDDPCDSIPSIVRANDAEYSELEQYVEQTLELFTALKMQLPSVLLTARIVSQLGLWDTCAQDKSTQKLRHHWLCYLADCAKNEGCRDLSEHLGPSVNSKVRKYNCTTYNTTSTSLCCL